MRSDREPAGRREARAPPTQVEDWTPRATASLEEEPAPELPGTEPAWGARAPGAGNWAHSLQGLCGKDWVPGSREGSRPPREVAPYFDSFSARRTAVSGLESSGSGPDLEDPEWGRKTHRRGLKAKTPVAGREPPALSRPSHCCLSYEKKCKLPPRILRTKFLKELKTGGGLDENSPALAAVTGVLTQVCTCWVPLGAAQTDGQASQTAFCDGTSFQGECPLGVGESRTRPRKTGRLRARGSAGLRAPPHISPMIYTPAPASPGQVWEPRALCAWENGAGSREPGMGEAASPEAKVPRQQPLKEMQKLLRNTQKLTRMSWA